MTCNLHTWGECSVVSSANLSPSWGRSDSGAHLEEHAAKQGRWQSLHAQGEFVPKLTGDGRGLLVGWRYHLVSVCWILELWPGKRCPYL